MNVDHYKMRKMIMRIHDKNRHLIGMELEVCESYEDAIREELSQSGIEFMDVHVGLLCLHRPIGEHMHVRILYREPIPSYTLKDMEVDKALHHSYDVWSDQVYDAVAYVFEEWFTLRGMDRSVGTDREDNMVIGWMVDVSMELLT